jgi:hypothetical protein
MSTLYEIKTIDFPKNKPSKAAVLKAVKAAIKQGYKAITVSWGENSIDLNINPHSYAGEWYGYGWIRDISGDDIAKGLSRQGDTKTTEFMRQHFNLLGV